MKPTFKRFFSTHFQNKPTLMGKPLIEILDSKRVLIENHKGISEYGTEQITVELQKGRVCVQGCNLLLRSVTKERLIISGSIYNLQMKTESEYEKI